MLGAGAPTETACWTNPEPISSARRRKQLIRILNNAADVLEELQNSLNVAVLEELNFPLNHPESTASDRELLRIVSRIAPEWPPNATAPPPETMIRALRLYAHTLALLHAISEDTEAHSSDSIPRYLISGYVIRATGGFNDASVAALIGSALSTGIYDETAHRMWRFRNYKRLEKEYGFLVHILAAIAEVTGPSA
jgi:hypothetical protein